MYSWGYVHAEDRIFQMGLRRALGQGRLSEFSGNKTIEVDKMMRELDIYGWAVKSAEKVTIS